VGVIDVGEFTPGEPKHLVAHGLRYPPWRRLTLVSVPQAFDALEGLADPRQCVLRLRERPVPGASKVAAAVRYLESLHV
jgi:hypothetical protein